MAWYQVLTIVGANLGMFLWAHRQARTDFLHNDRKIDENRKETNRILEVIRQEMTDFHGRMCAIEERRKEI